MEEKRVFRQSGYVFEKQIHSAMLARWPKTANKFFSDFCFLKFHSITFSEDKYSNQTTFSVNMYKQK